ncbi:MAG: glycoside hydrolase [Bacteroidetes bacterium]|jgi:hypothetical protein|nr:glycoside hydrolase [Bacteroidota bacterium]MDF1866423.1 sialidase family protein [Saprospiraceae bacterium]
MRNYLTLILLFFFQVNLSTQSTDYRKIETGFPIYANGYIDQPYLVVLEDKTWLCVFTTGSAEEGLGGQHIAASRSKDKGKTWSVPIPIEPSSGPAASWAMPYLTDYGRVYAFYIYNGDEVAELDGEPIRNDMLGWYCFKYSEDGGLTWSERNRIPVRVTAADLGNDFKGKTQIMWGIGKPVDVNDGMMFGFTKLGKYMLDFGEGWFMYSDNINSEKNPQNLNWKTLPDGEYGVKHPKYGSVQEEHNIFQLNSGELYCMYRTQLGYATQSYSNDAGKSWSMPDLATYIDGRPLKNSRACPRIWKCSNDKYLFWYHNHSGDHFASRNPAWLSGGIEKDGKIIWSQPEIVLYGEDYSYESGRFSYPDLIEDIDNGTYWVSQSSKVEARIHPIPAKILDGLWGQFERPKDRVEEGLVMEILDTAILNKGIVKIEGLPIHHEKGSVIIKGMEEGGGMTVEMSLKPRDFSHGRMILDTRSIVGSGIYIQTTGYRQIEVGVCNTEYCETWTTDPGMLDVINEHHVSLIIDNGPKTIMWVVDGKLCDGGTSRQFGWKRYPRFIGTVKTNKKNEMKVMPEEVLSLRVYDRALQVSEAVSNHNFWLNR